MKTYGQFITENTEYGLYTFRKPNPFSAEYVKSWMCDNRIPNTIPQSELHCTIVCSEVEVPRYTPDPTCVMVNPTTYKIGMLGDALVLEFKSDPFEAQWQRAMNLGAKNRWPQFHPHLSLSYKVPADYDYSHLKAPAVHLVFGEEQCRPMVDGWASLAGLKESIGASESGSAIYIPRTSLNVPRNQMPQISSAVTMEFLDWLEEQGCAVHLLDMPVAMLRCTQADINPKLVEALYEAPTEKLNKPLIISKDNYILDGHHRFLAHLNRDPYCAIAAYRVNLPINELLLTARQYVGATFKPSVRQSLTLATKV